MYLSEDCKLNHQTGINRFVERFSCKYLETAYLIDEIHFNERAFLRSQIAWYFCVHSVALYKVYETLDKSILFKGN
jgi:hypothetical protein